MRARCCVCHEALVDRVLQLEDVAWAEGGARRAAMEALGEGREECGGMARG